MGKLIISLAIVALVAGACVASKDADRRVHVVLIRKAPGKHLLAISKREWGGVLGPHGFVGYISVGYWAALEGSGPIFVNPHFQDNPSEFQCTGVITLDIEHKRVKVEMRRVAPERGGVEKAHPAHGTYTIETIRDSGPDEAWF